MSVDEASTFLSNQSGFRIELFPKNVSNDETEICWLLRPLVSARSQTGSSFISELTYVCNGTNLLTGDLRVESYLQAEDLGWL